MTTMITPDGAIHEHQAECVPSGCLPAPEWHEQNLAKGRDKCIVPHRNDGAHDREEFYRAVLSLDTFNTQIAVSAGTYDDAWKTCTLLQIGKLHSDEELTCVYLSDEQTKRLIAALQAYLEAK
jgi:hypothetical protein